VSTADGELGESLEAARRLVESRLLAELAPGGYWTGRLSSSALATAVAVAALARCEAATHRAAITGGLRWLGENVGDDGGFGDSPESPSNLCTTLLVRAAMMAAGLPEEEEIGRAVEDARARAGAWLHRRIGSLEPDDVAAAVLTAYGDDRTFSAPILLMVALCGSLGDSEQRWDLVPQLPFEAALVPHRLYRWFRLSVVSYALPALIAVGLARHRHGPTPNPLKRRLRDWATPRCLELLRGIQPPNGGFLEAGPLTSFVLLSLAASGLGDHPVARAGADYLLANQREDGSWPIDANLATWLTTLSVNALAGDEPGDSPLSAGQRKQIREWLLAQQLAEEHPFTHAAPGGWAWTDLPGGVPDADDTSGALLALRRLGPIDDRTRTAAARGVEWLTDLTNRDGGTPTFCRGWGKLPFDRSCPDISAHALAALEAWRDELQPGLAARAERAIAAGLGYLRSAQRSDGSWLPLWFGNQWMDNGANPVYGTAQVVAALARPGLRDQDGVAPLLEEGRAFLLAAQNEDGGWGSADGSHSSVEETALALTALAGAGDAAEAVGRGYRWLVERVLASEGFEAAPIGLYFASLWYSEKLYPTIFAAAALRGAGSSG